MERTNAESRKTLMVSPARQGRAKLPPWGGYSCEFVERPPSVVQCDCPLCLLVLREPHQASCCGHSFCEACVQRVQDTGKPCPTCNNATFSTFPDKRLKRSLYSFRVHCAHKEMGCEWAGELGTLDGHLNVQSPPEKLLLGCQFMEVECMFCVRPFQRCHFAAHQSEECPERPFE